MTIPFWLVQTIALLFLIALISGAFAIVIYVVGFEFDRVLTMGLSKKPESMSQKRWDAIQRTRKSQ